MRKLGWFIFIGVLLVFVCLPGCNGTEGENTNDMQVNETVVSLQEGSLSSTGLVLIVENKSDNCAVQFDNAYGLEKYNDGQWEMVEPIREVAITAEAYVVLPGESVEHAVNWENRYGSLPTGDYRLNKRIETLQNDGEDFNDLVGDYHISVSFSL